MRTLLGPNPSPEENTGHAYNNIGDQKNAKRCFREALELCQKDTSLIEEAFFLALGCSKRAKEI
jgi:Flp pilus assembly protein TadD